MGNVTRTQRLMATAGDARGCSDGAPHAAWSSSKVRPSIAAAAKACTHPVNATFGDLTTRWSEEAPL